MGKPRKWKKTPAPTSTSREQIEEYGMQLSRQQLSKSGFSPAVSTLTPDEAIEAWLEMVTRQIRRQTDNDGHSVRVQPQTRAILLLRNSTAYTPCRDLDTLEGILAFPDVGQLILQLIFEDGYRTAFRLALASKRIWQAVFCGTNYWDFLAGKLRNIASAAIFISATPEYTIQEMNISRLIDPHGLGLGTPAEEWHTAAIAREEDIINKITMVRSRAGPLRSIQKPIASKGTNKPDVPPPKDIARVFDAQTIEAIRSIQDTGGIWRASQFTANTPDSIYEPQMIYAATHLQLLLLQLFKQKNAVRVLYFHKTPLLDRRILSIILRACPQVVMLGIYDCPLLHFGDVLSLLDLIHEVNRQRRRDKLPQVTALDFYPHNRRTSSGNGDCVTVTRDSVDLDVLQRGFYAVLLKAFAKAKSMNLGLLFTEGKAFRSYLFRIPNPPLSVLSFLDAIERHTELKRIGRFSENNHRKTIYDVLKPVRLGLEPALENDWPDWYCTVMGDHLVFCSSCGYEMLREFFTAGARRMRPHRRVCAACTIQYLVDKEPHGMRQEKLGAISTLLPGWKREHFNKDAPLCLGSNGLVKLRSTVSKRPEINPLQENANGTMGARSYMEALVRDNKIQHDSMQGLPTLEELVVGDEQGELWRAFFHKCNDEDVYARAKRRLRDETAKERGNAASPAMEVSVTGTPAAGPLQEIWRRNEDGKEVQAYTYVTAARFFKALAFKGW